jgi:hypothetical protein
MKVLVAAMLGSQIVKSSLLTRFGTDQASKVANLSRLYQRTEPDLSLPNPTKIQCDAAYDSSFRERITFNICRGPSYAQRFLPYSGPNLTDPWISSLSYVPCIS